MVIDFYYEVREQLGDFGIDTDEEKITVSLRLSAVSSVTVQSIRQSKLVDIISFHKRGILSRLQQKIDSLMEDLDEN